MTELAQRQAPGRGVEARFVTGLQNNDAEALDEGSLPIAVLVDGQVAIASVMIGACR